jgi:hypothetical protein
MSFTTQPCEIISSLSFNEYVLIDCLKFNRNNSDGLHLHTSDFIAYSKQGFLNIFDELVTILKKNYRVKLFDNQIIFLYKRLVFIIKYVPDKLCLDNLMSKPGLDFYKCYYDGVKMYCTPESIRCCKTGEVQYIGKINIILPTVFGMYSYNYLKFKDEFWTDTNKEYITEHVNTLGVKKIKFKLGMIKSNYLDIVHTRFPTKSSVKEQKTLFGSKFLFTLKSTKNYSKKVYKFIDDVIFENPITSF